MRNYGYSCDAWRRYGEYRTRNSRIEAKFDGSLHKFTDANIPPGVKMNAYGSALESLENEFTPFDGTRAGNGATDDPDFEETGTKPFFVKLIGDLLDIALHENRVVTEEVSLLCNSFSVDIC
jgi:hypothetical protein